MASSSTSFDWDAARTTFLRDGVVVLPLLTKAAAARYAKRVVADVVGAPEYSVPPKVQRGADNKPISPPERHALGGFGGVWNSANHGKAARELIMHHFKLMKHFLWSHDNAKQHSLNSACLLHYVRECPDRLLVRDADSKVTAEAWHRDCADEASKASENDPSTVRLGGWIALQTATGAPQQFSCVPGTSAWAKVSGGFARLSKEDRAVFAPRAVTYNVPIGHCIVFDETIVHEVKPSRKPKGWPRGVPIPPQVRLFTAAEWSAHPTTQLPEGMAVLRQRLQDGAVMNLKSGQKQRGYPKMYWGPPKLTKHLEAAASRLNAPWVQSRTMKTRGTEHKTPYATDFPSMVEAGLPAPGYTREELAAFTHGANLLPPDAVDQKKRRAVSAAEPTASGAKKVRTRELPSELPSVPSSDEAALKAAVDALPRSAVHASQIERVLCAVQRMPPAVRGEVAARTASKVLPGMSPGHIGLGFQLLHLAGPTVNPTVVLAKWFKKWESEMYN